MIKRLRLTNFKAWKALHVRFATVTGIFGANSAGKSSLIQFLLLLKQTREATDRRIVLDFGGPESLANLGSFSEVVHGRETTARISWKLAWHLPTRLKISGQSADGRPVEFAGREMDTHCAIGLSDSGHSSTLFTRSLTYLFGDSSFTLKAGPGEGRKRAYDLKISSQHHDFALKRIQGRPFARIPPPVKTHSFPQQIKWSYQNADFLSDLELAYEDLMDRIYYLGPLREYPQRQYYWSGASPADVGPRGERAIDAILAATAQGEKRQLKKKAWQQPFQGIIAHWLRELQREGVVCVDDKRLIMGEYGRMTDHDGPPMPGSAFYKYLWQNMYNEEKVRQVQVEPRDSEGRDFDDPVLPPNNLKKDAKFLAVAVKAEAVVVNAVDSDWYEHRALTDDLGVRVRQLCPQHSTRRRATPRADDASR